MTDQFTKEHALIVLDRVRELRVLGITLPALSAGLSLKRQDGQVRTVVCEYETIAQMVEATDCLL